tara:strand:- start:572 stop:823 length:252 start_codon:yes stop_codon:yes gene_type:complete
MTNTRKHSLLEKLAVKASPLRLNQLLDDAFKAHQAEAAQNLAKAQARRLLKKTPIRHPESRWPPAPHNPHPGPVNPDINKLVR